MVIKLRLTSCCFNLLRIFINYFPLLSVLRFGPPTNRLAMVFTFVSFRALPLFHLLPMIFLPLLFPLAHFISLPLLKLSTIEGRYHHYNPSYGRYFHFHLLLYCLLRLKCGPGGVNFISPPNLLLPPFITIYCNADSGIQNLYIAMTLRSSLNFLGVVSFPLPLCACDAPYSA